MSETLKVAIIGNHNSPHVISRVQKLRQADNINVKVFDSSDFFPTKSPRSYSIKNILLELPKVNTILWLLKRYRAVQKYGADVVFIMYADYYSLLLSLFFRCNVVVSVWGGDILIEQGAIKNKLQESVVKRALRNADHIYCVSEQLKNHVTSILEEKGKTEPQVVMYGVDLKDYAMNVDSHTEDELSGSNKNTPFVIYSPRWCLPIYNIMGVIDAFSELNRVDKNTRLFYRNVDISGSDESNNYSKKVSKKLAENKLLENSETVGLVEKFDHIQQYKSSHVVISLSHSDGTPLTVLEAMALGKIVVCNRLPSLEAIIEDGVNGFLVNGNDPSEVAQKLLYIKQNYANLADSIGPIARQFVEKNANIDIEISTYLARFRKIAGK